MRHVVLVSAVLLGVVTTSAQTRTHGRGSATRQWSPPRTPDGQPDLQGTWISNVATPLERPKELEGRPLLTDKEIEILLRDDAKTLGLAQPVAPAKVFDFSLQREVNKELGVK